MIVMDPIDDAMRSIDRMKKDFSEAMTSYFSIYYDMSISLLENIRDKKGAYRIDMKSQSPVAIVCINLLNNSNYLTASYKTKYGYIDVTLTTKGREFLEKTDAIGDPKYAHLVREKLGIKSLDKF